MKAFRYYTDLINCQRLQTLDPVLFKHWVNLLCVATIMPEHWLPDRDILAFYLRVTEDEVDAIINKLRQLGLVCNSGSIYYLPDLKMLAGSPEADA